MKMKWMNKPENKKLVGYILFILFVIFMYMILIRYWKRQNNPYFEQFQNEKNSKDSKKSKKTTTSTTSTTSTPTKKPKTTSTKSPVVSKSGDLIAQGGVSDDTCDIKMDEWNGSPEEIEEQKKGLTKKQECQIKNMIKDSVRKNVMDALSAQNPLMTGPAGPIGPPGPAGSKLIASGKLLNQKGSYSKSNEVKRVATRTNGTNPSSSLIFLDEQTPFASYQDWQYTDNNQIKSRYDGTCLTFQPGQDELYMDTCSNNNQKQKWFWDKTNRLISLDTSQNKKGSIKCMTVSKPKTISTTASIPDCKGNKCENKGNVMYLMVKDCDPNNVRSDEIFGFD